MIAAFVTRRTLVAAAVVVASLAGLIAYREMQPLPQPRPIVRPPAVPPAALAVQPEPLEFRPITASQAEAINAAIPTATTIIPAARPFVLPELNLKDSNRSLECLSQAVYYEANSEGRDGQRAVAQVVLNRLRHPAYPKSVCGVVYQGSARRTGCQFTFTCDGALGRRPSERGWARASEVAAAALAGNVFAPVGYATHYHTTSVVPYWRASLVKLTTIGAHIFYRWAGGAGAPAAFVGRYAGGESDIAKPAAEAAAAMETPVVSDVPPARENRGSRAMIPVEAPLIAAAATPIATPTVEELLPAETGGRRRPGQGGSGIGFTAD